MLFFPYISNSQTIQEFYALFEHTYRKPLQNSETNQVLIDEKNAFIHIKNPLMPVDAVSFTYFIKEDKGKIFAFQYISAHVDLVMAVPRAEFYVFKDNKWQDVTDDVRPNLGFEDFWGNQPLPDKSLLEFNLELVLPQVGTTVLAKSSPAYAFQFPYSNLPKGYLETFEKRKFKTIELNWNKKTGKFDTGKRY